MIFLVFFHVFWLGGVQKLWPIDTHERGGCRDGNTETKKEKR